MCACAVQINAGYGEGSEGLYDGYVTNVHITDVHLEGPPPAEFCALQYIRELDLDGGRLTGPFPEWLRTCLPRLQELDLRFGRVA